MIEIAIPVEISGPADIGPGSSDDGHGYNSVRQMRGMFKVFEKTGGDLSQVAKAQAEDLLTLREEFFDLSTLIPYSYKVVNGLWTNGGRTLNEISDESEVGGGIIQRVIEAQNTMAKDKGIVQAAVVSEDFGSGRSYLYLFNRGEEKDEISALAIEIQGTRDELREIYGQLGQEKDFDKPLFFTRKNKIGVEDVFKATLKGFSQERKKEMKSYLDRLRRDVVRYPDLLVEHEKQVNGLAGKLQKEMLREKDTVSGLATMAHGVTQIAKNWINSQRGKYEERIGRVVTDEMRVKVDTKPSFFDHGGDFSSDGIWPLKEWLEADSRQIPKEKDAPADIKGNRQTKELPEIDNSQPEKVFIPPMIVYCRKLIDQTDFLLPGFEDVPLDKNLGQKGNNPQEIRVKIEPDGFTEVITPLIPVLILILQETASVNVKIADVDEGDMDRLDKKPNNWESQVVRDEVDEVENKEESQSLIFWQSLIAVLFVPPEQKNRSFQIEGIKKLEPRSTANTTIQKDDVFCKSQEQLPENFVEKKEKTIDWWRMITFRVLGDEEMISSPDTHQAEDTGEVPKDRHLLMVDKLAQLLFQDQEMFFYFSFDFDTNKLTNPLEAIREGLRFVSFLESASNTDFKSNSRVEFISNEVFKEVFNLGREVLVEISENLVGKENNQINSSIEAKKESLKALTLFLAIASQQDLSDEEKQILATFIYHQVKELEIDFSQDEEMRPLMEKIERISSFEAVFKQRLDLLVEIIASSLRGENIISMFDTNSQLLRKFLLSEIIFVFYLLFLKDRTKEYSIERLTNSNVLKVKRSLGQQGIFPRFAVIYYYHACYQSDEMTK